MADQVTNYKCPACTGPMHFVGASGKLECDYCGSSYELAEIEAMMAKAEASAMENFAAAEEKAEQAKAEGDESYNWGVEEGMKAYSCPSCGAELVCDETTVATCCPYCGNPTVVPGQFAGILKPDYILPFKLDEKQAKEALQNHYKGKKLLPNGFIDGNRIDEIKGVYVPFWLYDGSASGSGQYEGQQKKTYRRGDVEITETKHFDVHRAGRVSFTKIPVDASSKMPDAHMDAVEPYDLEELKEFSSVYLPGFLAEKYDQDKNECKPRAAKRMEQTAVDLMREDVKGYDTVSTIQANAKASITKGHYAMLPVYLLSTKWNGETYLFAMNGQTGKFIGDLPVDMGKFWKYFVTYTVGITAVLGTILYFIL